MGVDGPLSQSHGKVKLYSTLFPNEPASPQKAGNSTSSSIPKLWSLTYTDI